MIDRSKYLDVFIEEARENLQIVNNVLLELEENGYKDDSINEVFRIAHTIKGTAGVIGIDPIRELTHAMEDLFDQLRTVKIAPDKEQIELMYRCVDTIEKMLDELESKGTTTTEIKDLVSRIQNYMQKSPGDHVEQRTTAVQLPHIELSAEQKNQVMEAISEGNKVFEIGIIFRSDLQLKQGRAYQLLRKLSGSGFVVASAPAWSDVDDKDLGVSLMMITKSNKDDIVNISKDVTGVIDVKVAQFGQEDNAQVEVVGKKGEKGPGEEGQRGEKSLSTGSTIRVKSKLLDQLLDLVGEIMINNIRINQISSDLKNRELKQILQNNARLMSEMQDTVLRTRMVEVDFIFKRFPRMVRDMASENGKEIDFCMKGNDIEIDRSLLDEIGDALVHLLRNAVDHGIEPSEIRKRSGKSTKGSVVLSAFQEQSNIVITVEDDGYGMDPNVIASKAVQKGLISKEEADRLDDRSKLAFIFLPGFSTSEKITNVSGRGVGMDVVKTKIEGLGGFVRLETVAGKGSKITLKLPPSMSIIRAMLVEINNEKYAIPLENVRETVDVPLDQLHEVARSGMFRLRDEVLPVLNIHDEFGGSVGSTSKNMPALIVEKNENRACMVVTKLIGQQEIVVKNLGKDMRSTGYFSGATILGDGKVAMIIDVGAFV